MQQLLFAIIQNPQSASQIDVLGLMNYWSGLMNIQADLKDFAIQQPAPQVGPDGQPITPGAAPTPPAPGGAQQQGQ